MTEVERRLENFDELKTSLCWSSSGKWSALSAVCLSVMHPAKFQQLLLQICLLC